MEFKEDKRLIEIACDPRCTVGTPLRHEGKVIGKIIAVHPKTLSRSKAIIECDSIIIELLRSSGINIEQSLQN
jgi:hypothetical protein